MIQSNRLIIQSELKNEANTPRDLLNSIILHSENLEKSVKLASNSIKQSNDKQEDIKLKSFKEKFQKILNSKNSEIKKQRKIELIFERLENYVSISYNKKNFESNLNRRAGYVPERSSSVIERSGLENEKCFLRQEVGKDSEKIIWELREKVKEQEILLEEKEKKVQAVIRQLDKIQNLQAASLKSFRSHYDSHRNSVDASPELYRINIISPKFANYNRIKSKSEITESQWKKIRILKDNFKNIMNQASKLNKNSFFELNLEKLQCFIKECEKNLKEIESPCFKSKGKADKAEENLELNKEIKELKINKEAQSAEIKNLHGIILGFKRNVNLLEKERNELKNEINSNKTTLNTFTYNPFSEKKFEIVKEGSLSLPIVYNNENLIKGLRSQLKIIEKECIDLKFELKQTKIQKIVFEESSQTDDLKIKNFPGKPELKLCILDQLNIINKKECEYLENFHILEKKAAELEASVNFYCKKNKLSEIEKENLTKLLKSYEECLCTKDEKILYLNQESQQLRILIDKVKDEKKILEKENLLVKKSKKILEKCLYDKIIAFEGRVYKTFEIIYEAIELKVNYIATKCNKIEAIVKNQYFFQSQLKKSLELLHGRLLDKDKLIDSLQNSLKVTENTFSCLNSKQLETEKELKQITDKYLLIASQLRAKNEKDYKSPESILDQNDPEISDSLAIIEKFEEQEKNWIQKLDSQQIYIENLLKENESVKFETENLKKQLMHAKKIGKKNSFNDENEKLKEKNEELLRKIRESEEAEGKDLVYLKNLFQSQVTILDQECKQLKEQVEEYSNALKQERQKVVVLKIELERKMNKLSTELN